MMRLSKRSYGAFIFVGLAAVVSQGCARADRGEGDSKSESSPTGQAREALKGSVAKLVPWGHGLTYFPGGKDARAQGPEAIAFAGDDGFLVLDSIEHRLVHVSPNGLVHPFADHLPKDANGIAVSPKGNVAVHRAVTLSVSVYDTRGRLSGEVPVPAGARDADIVHFLSGERIMLEHPYQERYLLGSVAAPRQPETIVPSRREGVAEAFDEVGYSIEVHHPDGADDKLAQENPALARLGRAPARAGSHAYLVRHAPSGAAEQGTLPYGTAPVLDLGEANAGIVIGVSGSNVCAVLEHVDLAATVVHVDREVACASATSRQETARFKVETSSLYTPRQEFTYDGKRIGQAVPTPDGMLFRTVSLGEVSK